MGNYGWLLMIGVFTALQLLLLVARIAARRAVIPTGATAFVAFLGLAVRVVFLLTRPRHIPGPLWLVVAPDLLPLLSGLLGWLDLPLFWRWWYVVAGIGLYSLPWVVALVAAGHGTFSPA